jgi:hypothetical protein
MRFLLFWFALLAVVANAQNKGEPVSLHVKEVHRGQSDEINDKAIIYHITAVAESKTIIYSLQCDEIFSIEKHVYTGRCFSLSAGKDYSARKFDTAISFWPEEREGEKYLLIMYDTVSEREK